MTSDLFPYSSQFLVRLWCPVHASVVWFWTFFLRLLVSGSFLFGAGLPEEYVCRFFWEMTSGYVVSSASWFDSGHMLLPVYVFVGTRILRSILVLLSVVFSLLLLRARFEE